MKSLLLTTAALAALATAGSAGAADLPVKAPPIVAAAVYDWTGFYIGVNAGYTWSNSNSVDTVTTNVSSIGGLNGNIGGAVAANGTGSVHLRNDGFIGGGQIGYNRQFNNFVAGIEADIQGVARRSSQNTITNTGVPGVLIPVTSSATITSSRSLDYLGTVRGRIGILPKPSLLAYVTGGLAYGGVNTSTTIVERLGFVDTPAPFGTSGSLSTTRVGWTAGAGLEWMFAPNWSAKAEYLFYDLGTVTNTLPQIQQFGLNGTLLETVSNSRSSTHFDGSIVRVGINYKFGGGPVIAKY
jgi:outer membrane immunogenic protein